MERKTRQCSVCNSKYRFCNRCPEDKDKPNWYFAFCSSNCKDIYNITSKFENGQIIKSEAKTLLKKLDLSKLNNFGTSYKSSIRKIMKDSPVSINKKETDKNVTEIAENNNKVTDEEKDIKKNRNKKINVE